MIFLPSTTMGRRALWLLLPAGVAVFQEGERSVLPVALASPTFVGVVVLAVGEALGGH